MRALILALGLIATPASTNAWAVEEVENGCAAVATYNGGHHTTTLALGETVDRNAVMVLENLGWSTEENKRYDVYLLIDDKMFEGKAVGGTARGTLGSTLNLK